MRIHPWTLGLFLLAALPLRAQQPRPAYQRPPNVIIFYTDDLGYGDLSCYGGAHIHTPNIDYLADHGIRFTNGHAAASTCTPSRFSILTGEYAFRKKGTNILPGNAALVVPTDRMVLGKVFQQAGYHTAAIGKWHLGLGPSGGPDWNGVIKPGPCELGFDYSFLIPATPDRVPTVFVQNHHVYHLDPKDPITVSYRHPVGDLPTGQADPQLMKMRSSPGQGHLGTIINGIARIGFMSGGRSAWWTDSTISQVMTGQLLHFIRANRSHPFFVYFACHDVHVPRVPAHPFVGKSGMGPRGDEILEADWEVGQVLKTLREEHLTDNTLIVFSSDNGPVLDDGYQDGAVAGAAHPGMPRMPSDLEGQKRFSTETPHVPAGPLSGGKYSILDGGTRVPFITYWPGHIHPAVSGALVSQVDLVASFAALLHVPLGYQDAVDSKNMLSVFLGQSNQGRRRLVEQGGTLALVEGDYKYIKPHKGPQVFKQVNIATGFSLDPQLYDLKTDIGEHHNLAAQDTARVARMARELKAIQLAGRSR